MGVKGIGITDWLHAPWGVGGACTMNGRLYTITAVQANEFLLRTAMNEKVWIPWVIIWELSGHGQIWRVLAAYLTSGH